ncbi:MAG TPA: serine hydrolase domain-containing protein [Chitinophagaceae bacterium]|jgi:CubicO group peptidase (beta-lactamase class C family)|nr:serine hydrolase domain-containing protein [Chitinophagaceae bacterium]
MKKLLTILSLAVLFTFPVFSQDLNTKKLDSFFDSLESNNQVMGNFAVAKNGKIIYTRSIGYSAISGDEKVKVDNETKFRIGSVTKTFTATMIFQLIDEGKISLKKHLDEYFPQIPNANKITIEMLLKHRSGLYDYVNGPTDPEWIKKPQSRETILEAIIKGPPNFLPDKKAAYNNTGFYLLACIIEKITGQSYNENLQKRICSKLQMNNTYSPADNELKSNEANGYTLKDGKWVEVADNYFPDIVGVGDILSTTTDLILFINALLDGKLTSSKSLDLMGGSACKNCVGMGLMKIPFNKRTGLGHRGDTFGTHTFMIKFANGPITFSGCVNGQVFKLNDIGIGVLSICYDEKYEIPDFIAKEK